MPDGIEPLTREEHLQYIAFGKDAAHAKNPALAEKALRNLEVAQARYPEMMADLPLPRPLSQQLQEEGEEEGQPANQAQPHDVAHAQCQCHSLESLDAMIPFEYLVTAAHPAFTTTKTDATLIIDEPDQAINDTDIEIDRQGIAHGFAVFRTDPLLYHFCREQKEAMGVRTFSDALMVRWYRIGRKKLMEEDEGFAAMLGGNLELGLKRMREAREEEMLADLERSADAFIQAQLQGEVYQLQEAKERLARDVDEVSEAGGRTVSEDRKGGIEGGSKAS